MITVQTKDCLTAMTKMWEGGATFNLGFADPPFNMGKKYDRYHDRVSADKFEQWVKRWMLALWNLVSYDGVMVLHGNDDLAAIYTIVARQLNIPRIAWCLRHYRFGVNTRANFPITHDHCLVFGRRTTWNHDDILIQSDRARIYNDKRSRPDDEQFEGGGMRLPGTVWGVEGDPGFARVQGNNVERVPEMNNQLPELYIARIVKAFTNPGDFVIDPFAGSGTTAVVCQALDRHCFTTDISPNTNRLVRKRLKKGAVRV